MIGRLRRWAWRLGLAVMLAALPAGLPAASGQAATPAANLAANPAANPAAASANTPCGSVVLPTGLGIETVAEPVFSLHPILTNNSIYDAEVFTQLYRPVLWIGADLAVDLADSEAASLEVLDNNTLFRLQLKPWIWSDGVAVTADDVVYGFELIRALGPAYYAWGQDGMPELFASVRATGPLTLEIRTPHPVNPEWFEGLGLAQLYALPRHAWGGIDAEAQRSRSGDPAFFAVSDGPFRLSEYRVGRYVALAPNPHWIGRPPAMARLVLDFLAGVDPLEALRAGEIDAATVPFNVRARVAGMAGLRIVDLPQGPVFNGMFYNFDNPAVGFLHDLRVREAIADAVDQRAMLDVVYRGSGRMVYGPVPPADTAYLSADAAAGRFSVGYDPARARALLREAGYAPGPDGVLQKAGVRLEMTQLVSSNMPDPLLLAEFVQADLAKIGIRMHLRQMDFNQILALAYRSPLAWEVTAIGTDYPAYPDLGSNFTSTAQQNFGHFKDAEVDALLAQLAVTPGREALFKVQDRISAAQPELFLPQGPYSIVVDAGVEGFPEALQSNFQWKLEYLRLTGARRCTG